MAIMIPQVMHKFDPSSHEDVIFHALEELPDDHYVFHSFKIAKIDKRNYFWEREVDFLIFNPKKGILCIEAKAGSGIRYENGTWFYSNGIPMSSEGPYRQCETAKFFLMDDLDDNGLTDIKNHCKILHAVWFPDLSLTDLMSISLPPDANEELTLTKEALDNPIIYISKIFELSVGNIKTNLTKSQTDKLIRTYLCPKFNILPSYTFQTDIKKMVFHRLLEEQARILYFIEEQQTAIINGAAGTGKTMIALMKAQKHAANGEKVLFLCYNNLLKKHLERLPAVNNNNNIDFYTISGLACSLCHTSKPDYLKLKHELEKLYFAEEFPYKHVIVDEGQDFGIDAIEESDILEILQNIVTDKEENNGSFYIFYDKMQMIQSNHIPKYIKDADCKLTLYRNCRNTENIAKTALKPITENKPKLIESAVRGDPPTINFCVSEESAIRKIESLISEYLAVGISDIVLLTCKTEDTGLLAKLVTNGYYKEKYLYTSCRKFKGLEADAVILMDLDSSTFTENVLIYYVGTSRARIKLDIVTTMSDEMCEDVLRNCLQYKAKIRVPKKTLADELCAVGINVKG